MVDMKSIVDLARARGFVYPGSEIYGGLANSWDYGPLGSLLKENIKHAWIKHFVQSRTDMTLIDSALIMNPRVWVASGHVAGFSDPLMDCRACKNRQRADKLVETYLDTTRDTEVPANWAGDKTPSEDLHAYVVTKKIKCPECGACDWTEIRRFNLMFKTHLGVTDDASSAVYLRPETAQGMFVDFMSVARTSRKKLPFGIGQAGKSFRNEITPGNFIYRTREFEQMEIEFFVTPGTDEVWFETWLEESMNFLTGVLGLDNDKVRFREIPKGELPHYSRRAGDVEYQFPFGWGEVETLANRTDYDLSSHARESGQDCSYFDPTDNTKYVPYVIEPAMGLSRLVLAVLANSYTEVPTEEGSRIVLKLPARLAPIKVAILPLVKRLAPEAHELFKLLSPHFMCEYDEAGAIGKRYYRWDEAGAPFAISVDSERWAEGAVTVRERDTGVQTVVAMAELVAWLQTRMQ